MGGGIEEGRFVPSRTLVAALLISAAITFTGEGGSARGAEVTGDSPLTAELDGKPIPLADVSRYFCDDFAYPVIRCSRTALIADLRATTTMLLTGIDYVTMFDQPSYGGAFMHVSQDYSALVLIGWNDKVSSFKVRNSETGRFWTDWFWSGSTWSFCCNTQQPTLGGYDNTFSSVQRT
jgi:hypothetical protein